MLAAAEEASKDATDKNHFLKFSGKFQTAGGAGRKGNFPTRLSYTLASQSSTAD
jgi:hypothetical protein